MSGVDLSATLDDASPAVDQAPGDVDGLSSVGPADGGRVVLSRGLVPKKLRQLTGGAATFLASHLEELDGVGMVAARTLPEQRARYRIAGVDPSCNGATRCNIPAPRLEILHRCGEPLVSLREIRPDIGG